MGLRQPPTIEGLADPLAGIDVAFYVMSTSEAAVAAFLDGLSTTRALGLVSVSIERGFQREDGRELFGFLDGARKRAEQRASRHQPCRSRHLTRGAGAHTAAADRALAPFPVGPVAEVPFSIERRRQPLEVVNRLRQVGPYGAIGG